MSLASRRDRRLAVALAVSLAWCLAVSACSPVARYRVLSAVFDGVPPPPGMVVAPADALEPAVAGASAFGEGMDRLRAARPPRTPLPTIVSVHRPVAERKCRECHDLNTPDAGLRHDATLCDRCHKEQRQRENWDHGPINLGTCIPCHVPHRSPNAHLLAVATPQLCLNCHEGVTPESADYHCVDNFDDCTGCHDPHRMY